MPNPERPDMDRELSRFWNELVHPGLEPDQGELPTDQAETLLRLHGMTQAPLPEMARAAATRAIPLFLIVVAEPGLRPQNGHAPTDWRRAAVITHASAWGDATPTTPPAAPVAPAAPILPPAARRRVWTSLQLAMSLLLVTAVGLVYFAFGPARFRPEPRAGAALETVFAATLPAEMIPAASNLDFLVWRTALPPGIQATNEPPIPGFQLQHVLEGELMLTAEKALQVYRNSADTLGIAGGDEAPPETPVILRPGDTAVYPFDQKMTYENRSSTPVELVGGGLFSGYGGWFPAEFTLIDHNEQYPVDELAPGPVQVSLVRTVLPPEGEVPAPPPGSLIFDVGAIKESDIAKRMDGSLRNIGPEDAAIYVLTLTPLGAEHSRKGGNG